VNGSRPFDYCIFVLHYLEISFYLYFAAIKQGYLPLLIVIKQYYKTKKEKNRQDGPSTILPVIERGDLPAATGLSGRNAGFKEVKRPAKQAFNENYIKLYLGRAT